MYKATEDICLTKDRQRAVPITHPEAFSLLAPAGGELTDEEAAAYGLIVSASQSSSSSPVGAAENPTLSRRRLPRQS